MTFTADAIMHLDGQILPFSRDLREALATYARRTWPLNTSVHAAKAWGIPKTTAANLLKGHASDATVTKIMRAGGWAIALPVLAAVIGEPVHAFFDHQLKQAAIQAEKAKQHEELARAAYRRLAGRSDRDGDAGDGSPTTRETRSYARKVGSKEARRIAG